MFSHPFSSTATRARRLITGLALLAYVASVVGYPLPLPALASQDGAARDASVPFPCQGHACGCQSAAQCLDNCCCYTAAERLAWVHKNAIALPAATMAALEKKAEQDSPSAAGGSCCQRGGHCDDDDAEAARQAGGFVWVNAIQAQKCQGLTTLWIASGANLPLEIRPLWEFDWAPAGETALLNDATFVVSYRPDVPPPRS